MTPTQCRAARARLELSQAALAAVARVPATVIADFEMGAWTRPADIQALQRALEYVGVEFIGDMRVRLRKGK